MTIMLRSEVIPTYFKELTDSPRTNFVTYLHLSDNCVSNYFFTETCSENGAGVAESFLTHNVVSLISGHEPESYVQLLSKEEAGHLSWLSHMFNVWKGRAECAAFEKRSDAETIYEDKASYLEKDAAEMYNARLFFYSECLGKGGFTLFPDPVVIKETVVQKLKKKLSKKKPSKKAVKK
jgi:hypothetical protein